MPCSFRCWSRPCRLRLCNPVAERNAFARPASELLGKVIWDIFPQTVGGEIYQQYHMAVNSGQPVHFEARSRILEKWWEIHAYPRRGRLEVYLREITDRRRTEETLRATDERLRLAQNNAGVGVWAWNHQTGELNWDPELEHLYGLSPGTIRTYHDWAQRVHPDDLARVEVGRDAALARREQLHLEFRIRHSSGELRWIAANGKGTYTEAGEGHEPHCFRQAALGC